MRNYAEGALSIKRPLAPQGGDNFFFLIGEYGSERIITLTFLFSVW